MKHSWMRIRWRLIVAIALCLLTGRSDSKMDLRRELSPVLLQQMERRLLATPRLEWRQ